MAFYFCYSSALDVESLNEWKNQHGYPDFKLPEGKLAEAVDHELVADFPSRFWGGRVLGLQKNIGKKCQGILFEINNDKDWHVIRHKEGIVTGASIEIEIPVEIAGQKINAKAFITHPSRRSLEGALSARFFEALEKAYTHWGLRTDSLSQLL